MVETESVETESIKDRGSVTGSRDSGMECKLPTHDSMPLTWH